MQDDEFFDFMYQGWTRTTGSEDRFWQPVEYEDHSGRWRVYAIAEDQSRKLIASDMRSEDAAFTASVHGCFADLIRRLKDYEDQNERLDCEKDDLIGQVAQLEQAADAAIGIQISLEERLDKKDLELSEAGSYIDHLGIEIRDLERELDARP